MVLSVYTLYDIYTGDASSCSSALHYNTIIIIYKYTLHRFTHTDMLYNVIRLLIPILQYALYIVNR